jgi:hypothetical protein
MSSSNLIPPTCEPEKRKPEVAGTLVGVKQSRWSPESAAEKVNFPVEEPRWATMRWSLSKVSSTVM